MSRCYLDTSFLHAHLRQPAEGADRRVAAWRDRVFNALGADAGVVSALVMDELAYRSILAWLRDDGSPDPLSEYREHARTVTRSMAQRLARLWQAVDSLPLELVVTDRHTVTGARTFMSDAGLPPRDALHAAHAVQSGCAAIVSADRDFAGLEGLLHIGPS